GAETDEPGGLSGQLPRAEALVGDGAVGENALGAHVVVGGQDVAGGGEEQGDGELGDGVGVAPRRVEHGDAGGGCAGDVDVVGIAARRGDGAQRDVEYDALDLVALDDQHV